MSRPILVVGLTGASGTAYAVRMLQVLRDLPVETHLIVSRAAVVTMGHESDYTLEQIESLADVVHDNTNLAAAISSGSFRTMGMIIIPCSVKTMSEIANGINSSLISRAADVVLKERRRLVLVVRESPLHAGHFETMLKLSHMGAIIAPPMPAMYARPKTVDDIVNHTVVRVLDLFDMDLKGINRWGQGA